MDKREVDYMDEVDGPRKKEAFFSIFRRVHYVHEVHTLSTSSTLFLRRSLSCAASPHGCFEIFLELLKSMGKIFTTEANSHMSLSKV